VAAFYKQWPPCEEVNEAVCNRNFSFMFKADNAKENSYKDS